MTIQIKDKNFKDELKQRLLEEIEQGNYENQLIGVWYFHFKTLNLTIKRNNNNLFCGNNCFYVLFSHDFIDDLITTHEIYSLKDYKQKQKTLKQKYDRMRIFGKDK